MSSSRPRASSPTPSPTPRSSLRRAEEAYEGSPDASPDSTTLTVVKRRAESTSPVSDRTAPPTIEELEAMVRDEEKWEEEDGDRIPPPASNPSSGSKHGVITQSAARRTGVSRQISRVSGTGRTGLQHAPKPETRMVLARPETRMVLAHPETRMVLAQPSVRGLRRGRSEESMSTDLVTEEGPRARSRPRGRNTNAEGFGNRRGNNVQQGQLVPRTRSSGHIPVVGRAAKGISRQQPSGRRAPSSYANSTRRDNANVPNITSRAAMQRDKRGPSRRAPYSAQGPSSTWQEQERTNKRPEQRKHSASAFGDGSWSRDDATSTPHEISPPQLRRRNSAPDFGDVETFEEEPVLDAMIPEPSPHANSSTREATCWGGGLPPIRNAIAQGPPAARAAAAKALPTSERFPDSKYPATDRESFARTLNEDELDEVWQGLGEGVSQRGCGSDVAFEGAPGPMTPSVTGGVRLTPALLQRHDQMAVGEGSRPANVMPIPKTMGDKEANDMENGAPSSKKSVRTSNSEQPSLLSAIVSYGVLVLWMAHLVFNVLLLWPVVVDHYLWAVCFVPGVLGVLLSFNSCRNSHHHCKPTVEVEQEEQRRRGPHACALPAYIVLLLSVLVALGMHASGLLFCEKNMQLFLEESTVEPLCDRSLLLPVVLDAVLLSVASLKASSLCWAWVLS